VRSAGIRSSISSSAAVERRMHRTSPYQFTYFQRAVSTARSSSFLQIGADGSVNVSKLAPDRT